MKTKRKQNQPFLKREDTEGHKAQGVKLKEEEKQLFVHEPEGIWKICDSIGRNLK